jgi:hypothetical protein
MRSTNKFLGIKKDSRWLSQRQTPTPNLVNIVTPAKGDSPVEKKVVGINGHLLK